MGIIWRPEIIPDELDYGRDTISDLDERDKQIQKIIAQSNSNVANLAESLLYAKQLNKELENEIFRLSGEMSMLQNEFENQHAELMRIKKMNESSDEEILIDEIHI